LHTIRDVARLADVAVGTVSKVLNSKGTVSPKLRQRVLSAMEALDYRPDQVARSLKVRQTQTIGMVIPDITNPFFGDVVRGVEAEARARGYSLILCDSNEDPATEQADLDTLFARRVDGVLIAPAGDTPAPDRVALRRFPLVFFDRIPPGFTGSAVLTNNLEAVFEATRHLMAMGHRRLAIITGRPNLSSARDRLEGFRKALQQEGVLLRSEYLRQGDFQVESGYNCGLELLRLPSPPTAIFSCNNQMTLGLMRAVAELHVPCPAQVSVLGFDDFLWAANFSPRLTAIAQPSFEMGKLATQMLLGKINSLREKACDDQEQVLVLKAELRLRDSTAAPCPEDALAGSAKPAI
jgi:LacI family transcriptional regulator, galactose operon repressor